MTDWIDAREERKRTFWDSPADVYEDNISLSLSSLKLYVNQKNVAITYSGGKDSSATLALVVYAIQNNLIDPKDVIVLYADTGLELPPLAVTAERTLSRLTELGIKTRTVKAPVENRLYVKMLGYGYPYPNNRRRWCTRLLKQEPMKRALEELEGEWVILTGVRLGESDQRDARITASCSTGDGECGQGWYAQNSNSLAPLVHWRACHVFKFLFNDDRNPLPILRGIEDVYKLDEFVPNGIRTGCIKCQVVHEDRSFKHLVDKVPEWSWLSPLHELDKLHEWLAKPAQRVMKDKVSYKVDGTLRDRSTNILGAISTEARLEGLEWIKRIQDATNANAPDGLAVTLVSGEEEQAIRQMIKDKVYPQGWDDGHLRGSEIVDVPIVINGQLAGIQRALPNLKPNGAC